MNTRYILLFIALFGLTLSQFTACPAERPTAADCVDEPDDPVCAIKTNGANQNFDNACEACVDTTVLGTIDGACGGSDPGQVKQTTSQTSQTKTGTTRLILRRVGGRLVAVRQPARRVVRLVRRI